MSEGIANPKQTIFISYARDPDEALAKQLSKILNKMVSVFGGIVSLWRIVVALFFKNFVMPSQNVID